MTELTLQSLKPARGSRLKSKRRGRGPGSGKGKTAGRGTKGQRARSGGRSGLKLKGMKRIVLRVPKTRGFTSRRNKPATVTLERLDRAFQDGTNVTLELLKARKLIPSTAKRVRIVLTGEVTKILKIQEGITATPNAKAAIVRVGGSFASESKKK